MQNLEDPIMCYKNIIYQNHIYVNVNEKPRD
jgi:hypothetical protein